MSWGVNLGLAGAAARGMREAQQDQSNLEFQEKARDYHLKKLASDEAMRPQREAEERGRLAYNTELYKGQSANLPAQQENKALELGVNSAKLRVESAEMERRTKVQEAERAATMSAFSEGQKQGLKPDQMMPLLFDHLQRAAVANNDPVRVQQLAELMNSEKANTAWRLLQDTVRAQLIGDQSALATAATNLYNTLNPGTPGSLEPIAQEAVGGSPMPAPSGFRLKMTQPDGQIIERMLAPEQMQQLVLGYINSVSGNFASALEGQREVAKQRAIAQAKGEQDRETAAFKGENFVKVKTGENSESLYDTQTGQMIGGGMGAAGGGADLTPKQVDQVRQATEAIVKANGMSLMTAEGQKMMSDVMSRATAYLRMGVQDKYGQPLDANSATALALEVATGRISEDSLRRGTPRNAGGFGVNPQPAAPSVAPSTGAAPATAPSPATAMPEGLDPSKFTAGRASDGTPQVKAAQPDANGVAGYRLYQTQDGKQTWFAMDANEQPIIRDGKPVPYQAAGATPAPATPGVDVRPESTATAAGAGEALPATPATPPAPAAAPSPDTARADLVAKAREMDRNIALLRTQIQNERPGLNVAGAKKALASFEQRRAALGISAEEVAAFDKENAVRQDSEARARAARVQATIRPTSPDPRGAKPSRPVDVLDDEVVSPSPSQTASTAPTSAAPSAATPAPARPRPAAAPAVGGVNALSPTAFSPDMGTNITPAAATPSASAPPATPAPRKTEGRKPAPAGNPAEGANEFERTKGYGVRGKGKPDKGQDTTGTKPAQGMAQLPKPETVTSMGEESAPNHIVNVRRQVAAQAPERLQRADLAFFEKYTQFMQPEEQRRWVKALNERIAKDGMSGLVPKTRKYVIDGNGNLSRAAN